MRADQLTAPVAHHGEGPVWDDEEDRLLWVDLLRGDLLACVPGDDSVRRSHVGAVAGCFRLRKEGGAVVATERGFVLTDASFEVIEELPEVWADTGVRMNDGACDPQGRFYAGSMAYDETPGAGRLFRLDPDRSVSEVRSDLTIANGLGWSSDGTTAFHVDTPTGRVDRLAFDPDTGTFNGSEPFARIADGAGFPDGLAVDAEDGVWVALWDGGAVHRYAGDGSLDAIIELPVRRPTSCAFGGDAFTELFITTSAVDQAGDPAAGAVFHVVPGVRGVAASRFAA